MGIVITIRSFTGHIATMSKLSSLISALVCRC